MNVINVHGEKVKITLSHIHLCYFTSLTLCINFFMQCAKNKLKSLVILLLHDSLSATDADKNGNDDTGSV